MVRDEDEDEGSKRPRKQGGGSALPWIIGCGGAAALVLVLTGVIVVVVLLKSGDSSQVANNTPPAPPAPLIQPQHPFQQPQPFQQPVNPPVVNPPANTAIEGQPVAQPANPPQGEVKPPPVAIEDAPRNPRPSARNGDLSREAHEAVKRATVYLRVTMSDGSRASGTGFFGSVEARNIILTNAHVVGMLAPESRRPKAIEVFVNSGQPDEWKTTARVLGIDRSSDLAVLDIGTPSKSTPQPLTVKSAKDLQERDPLIIYGFPLGEQLGKEISVNDTKVSSLRKKGGVLDRIQVSGGMNPGNSGGPLIDTTGAVVGVAVSGIPGREINFAIPGERVHTILDGRIAGLAFHQPYFVEGNKIAVPTVTEMIDPRNLIKEVSLEVWSGDKPADAKTARRPPATVQPGQQPGDSSRLSFKLDYRQGEGRKDIILPELPPGKVWWQQPKWVNAKGESHWASAGLLRLPTQPVKRDPARLVLNYPRGAARPITLTIQNSLKVSSDDDNDAFRMVTIAEFLETVMSSGSGGSGLRLQYRKVKRDVTDPTGKTHPSQLLAQIKSDLPRLVTRLQVDPLGNIARQSFEPIQRISRPQLEQLKDFHQVIQQGLETMSVSMPPSGTVKPLDSWRGERHLPIDTPGKFESGKLDMTFTYLGVRKRDGRDEAVLAIEGVAHGSRDSVSGKATGTVLVDLITGQTILANITVVLDLDAVVSGIGKGPQKVKFIATTRVRLERKL